MWILIDFKIHQDYIAKVLCINKDEPKSGCGGKCYLSTQLKEQEDKENKQVPVNSNEKNEVLFLNDYTFKRDPNQKLKMKRKKWGMYKVFYSFQYLQQIFHPPQIS